MPSIALFTKRATGASNILILCASNSLFIAIESAGKKAGHPVGPLAVVDEINIGLAAHIRDQNREEISGKEKKLSKGKWDIVIDFMIKDVKRLGRSDGGGFYEYPESGKKYLWPELKTYFPLSKKPLSQDEMIDRFCFIQCIETIRCFEEGVLNSVADANIGSIFGWGFAPFKGGTLQFVNDYGLKKFVQRAKELKEHYGNRFSPPKLLLDMAVKEKLFI